MGRYQQRKAQGVKIRNQRMERPKAVPLAASLVNQARHASRFRNKVTECTRKGQGEKSGLTPGGLEIGCPQSKLHPRKDHAVKEAVKIMRTSVYTKGRLASRSWFSGTSHQGPSFL